MVKMSRWPGVTTGESKEERVSITPNKLVAEKAHVGYDEGCVSRENT